MQPAPYCSFPEFLNSNLQTKHMITWGPFLRIAYIQEIQVYFLVKLVSHLNLNTICILRKTIQTTRLCSQGHVPRACSPGTVGSIRCWSLDAVLFVGPSNKSHSLRTWFPKMAFLIHTLSPFKKKKSSLLFLRLLSTIWVSFWPPFL